MSKNAALMLTLTLLGIAPAHAINAKFAQQLERSGCTQVTEAQGCDIHKTKAENAKAGFGAAPTADTSVSPYAGEWVATFPETGAKVATIRIDGKDRVLVNGKQVKAKKSDGALVFRSGTITYTIQGDRRLKGEDVWVDNDAGSKGVINAK
ncbi:hypothetical protein [Serratia fonticola]|uniref:hypothetical protein n=1 Tax=Serratia fonticola TaxID=47917 RepID=UPI0015C654D8|nr:hypothetical protein [Serratia fonticola]MBP0995776.1 hypothetical protein [Serratia fonticola]MBP1000806.1 hypothetical protein [Serratia fonticola]MBP1010637.1 hypothetical protein [Serratia fonticola]NYA43156.1 hypothetical protein [Serratia fonticola]CAI0787148.1 Uncharacterised protein [Serratia fonticola]